MKKNLFAELEAGFDALADERLGKATFRKTDVENVLRVDMSAAEVLRVRTKLNMSQPGFASYFQIDVKTLANWEVGARHPPHRRRSCSSWSNAILSYSTRSPCFAYPNNEWTR